MSQYPIRAHLWTSLLVALLCLCGPRIAKADTYIIKPLQGDFHDTVANGDDYGDYTLLAVNETANGTCNGKNSSGPCYVTYFASGQVAYSNTLPVLPADPHPTAGSGCSIDTSAYLVFSTYCNNGHELIFAFNTAETLRGLFDGPNPGTDLIYAGSVDGPLVFTDDSDFYFTDGVVDVNLEAVDLSTTPAAATPEPRSLILLATAAVAAWTARRRVVRE